MTCRIFFFHHTGRNRLLYVAVLNMTEVKTVRFTALHHFLPPPQSSTEILLKNTNNEEEEEEEEA